MQDIWPVTPKEVMIYTMRTFLLDVSILYEFFFFSKLGLKCDH